ncbi:cell wall hydrolase [Phenylobacterium sp.]|nr:cell wall hydrolase [Phenylobacterium sp.]MDP1988073.1 cell wall hydrolase [Phenylobacterium sp.]
MAGGMASAATDHARAARLAAGAADGYSEQALQDAAARMDPGVLRIARRHDPFTVAGAAERDRQSAILVARLERGAGAASQPPILRASLNATPYPAAPFRLGGALEASREVECLTQAVYYEARGETPAGQAAVAQVVINRARHPAFPKTVCGVVFQGANSRVCQFSFACNGVMRRPVEPAAWRRAERVANRALSGEVMADVGHATHFHTTAVAPAWGPRLTRVTQVGQHVFYRFGRGAPSRMLASAHEVTQEQAEAPVYARVGETVQQAAAESASTDDIRLTSAVLVPTGEMSMGKGGPAEPATEPASAPVASRKEGGKPEASAKDADAKPATSAKGEAKAARDESSADKPATKPKAGQTA